MSTPAALPAELAPWLATLQAALRRHLGPDLEVLGCERLTAGATKQTWLLQIQGAPGVQGQLDATAREATATAATASAASRWIYQRTLIDPPDAMDSGAARGHRTGLNGQNSLKLSPAHDARLVRLAHAQGVPCPQVLCVLEDTDEAGPAVVTQCVDGETLAARILREPRWAHARAALPAQCARALARIHALPTDSADFLPLRTAASMWRGMRDEVDRCGLQHPVLEWALRWVELRMDAIDAGLESTCVVHGDFRLGNLIVNEQGLASVIDWELAMRADPLLDLAWPCLRTWQFGGAGSALGVGDRSSFLASYSAASGRPVDASRLNFWDMFCQLRWAVMCLGMGQGTGQGAAGAEPTSVSLEHRLVGRRMAEPLWDMVQMALQGELSATSQPEGMPADPLEELTLPSTPLDADLLASAMQHLKARLVPALPASAQFDARLLGNALAMLQRSAQAMSERSAQVATAVAAAAPQSDSTASHAAQTLAARIRAGLEDNAGKPLLIRLQGALRAQLMSHNPKWL